MTTWVIVKSDLSGDMSVLAEYPGMTAAGYPDFAITPFMQSICPGPDNNLWAIYNTGPPDEEATAAGLTRCTLAGATTDVETGEIDEWPLSVCNGPNDGNVWFNMAGNDSGAYGWGWIPTSTLVPTGHSGYSSGGQGVCVGSDGYVWATFMGNPIITAYLDVVNWSVGGDSGIGSGDPSFYGGAFAICSGPDGNLWFTLLSYPGGDYYVGTCSPTVSDSITLYATPSNCPVIDIASDGSTYLWVTSADSSGNIQFLRVTPSDGSMTVFDTSIGPADLTDTPLCLAPNGLFYVLSGSITGEIYQYTPGDTTMTALETPSGVNPIGGICMGPPAGPGNLPFTGVIGMGTSGALPGPYGYLYFTAEQT